MSASTLCNHINSVHISRQKLPTVSTTICFVLPQYVIGNTIRDFVQTGFLRTVNGGIFCYYGIILDLVVALGDV